MKILIGILIVLMVVAVIVLVMLPPRPPKTVQSIEEMEGYLNRLVASNQPPGLSLAVVKDGQISYTYAAGYADGPNQVPAQTDTVYHWWSMTKVPTAIAILQLYEAGKLDLDQPVADYLPYITETDPALAAVTIRQLLRHSSGLPDAVPDILTWVHTEDKTYDQTALVKENLEKFGMLKYEPDTDAAYTNFGYMVLGAVIEASSGQIYEDYIRQNVLVPAGMTQTDYIYTPEMTPHEAVGSHPPLSIYTPMMPFLYDLDSFVRQRKNGILWFNRVYIDATPSTGLIGSAEDAARFMIAYMDAEALLSEESKAAMLPTGEGPTQRPLGWAQYALGDRSWVQHNGGGPGFATSMRIYPEENLGVVILSNGTNMNREGLVELLAGLDWE